MKKITIICLLLASLRASGDLVLVERTVETRQQPRITTVKIKGDKCRKDFPDNTSLIYDLATGDCIQINHTAKTFRKISKSQTDAMMKSLRQAEGDLPPAPPKITDTGKKEQVDGHEAEVFTAQTPDAAYTWWVTKDYPNYAALNEEMAKLRGHGGARQGVANFSPDPSVLDGLVVKSKILSGSGESTTITLVSAKTQPLDDSQFQPPAEYKEITPPAPKP